MPLWDGTIARKQRTTEILAHKLKGNDHMLNAQSLTMHAGKWNFLGIMIAAIVKGNSQSNSLLIIV